MRKKLFSDWVAEDRETRERVATLVAGLPKPYRRRRPRAAGEARLLQERGTPERLIGPERPKT
jgi:hypothetical protein